MFKLILKIIVFTCFFNISFSQNGEINIIQDSLVSKIENLKISIDKENFKSEFFTIQIFYGSLEKSMSIMENFKEKFPEENPSISFETPNYKVQFGKYKFRIRGVKKLDTIKKYFPSAFLLKKVL
tara:strand:+ start:157 stop:531 length:375 start_codon:yes stop_codon:yes gene_type:complete